jgi:hypothetical protein
VMRKIETLFYDVLLLQCDSVVTSTSYISS